MHSPRWIRWMSTLAGGAILFQCGSCDCNDFFIGLAGAGAIASGVINFVFAFS